MAINALLLLFIDVEKGTQTIDKVMQYVKYYIMGSDDLQRLCDESCKDAIV